MARRVVSAETITADDALSRLVRASRVVRLTTDSHDSSGLSGWLRARSAPH